MFISQTTLTKRSNPGRYAALAYIVSPASRPPRRSPGRLQCVLEANFGPAASLVASRYPLAAFNSTPFPAFSAVAQMITDADFLCPSHTRLTRAVQKDTPVWSYVWGQAPTCPWYSVIPASVVPDIFGAAHTAEIPFVFANVDGNPPPNGTCNFTSAEKSLSREFVSFWTSMAANGEPGSEWPAFSTNASLGLNVENGSSAVTHGVVDYSVCSFWSTVQSTILQNSSVAANSSSAGNGTHTTSPQAATLSLDILQISCLLRPCVYNRSFSIRPVGAWSNSRICWPWLGHQLERCSFPGSKPMCCY